MSTACLSLSRAEQVVSPLALPLQPTHSCQARSLTLPHSPPLPSTFSLVAGVIHCHAYMLRFLLSDSTVSLFPSTSVVGDRRNLPGPLFNRSS
ncbi:hypothetical protein CLOM_g1158 [Closterium sp. NIES-68]|nr:hypothetical protein CLOM_g1158 [Closterium sp. NIES-68]GJP65260.1 hypothetical protein CLOP_g22170 [Closterium sp. NIES-67]